MKDFLSNKLKIKKGHRSGSSGSSIRSSSSNMSSTSSAAGSASSGGGIPTPTADAMSISGSTLHSAEPSQADTQTPDATVVTPSVTSPLSAGTPPPTVIQITTLSTKTSTLLSQDTSMSFQTLISLTPPPSLNRQPITLMCVIDISGSMTTVATIKTNENGQEITESDGLSVLDVVKHAMRTIIASLGPRDQLGIVTFSDSARIEMGVQRMDENGKKAAGEVVEKMRVEGMTNLWDGIKTGLNELARHKSEPNDKSDKGSVTGLFVLTDGCPNVEPPRGSVAMLKSYFDGKDKETVRGVSVNTFGFGYSLDSKILLELAEVGRGSFVFIPDAGMVGTAFINALSTMFVTMAMNAVLSVELLEDRGGGGSMQVELVSQGKRLATVDGMELHRAYLSDATGNSGTNSIAGGDEEDEEWILGGHECTKTTWGVQIYLGSIQYGQTKDLVLQLSDLPGLAKPEKRPVLNLKLTYELCHPTDLKTFLLEGVSYPSQPPTQDALSLISYHHSRLLTVSTLNTILRTEYNATRTANAEEPTSKFSMYLTNKSIEPIKSSPSSSSALTKALLADLTGQFSLALSQQTFFNRWGRHYLRSLSRAHLLQQCTNFKDPGVQVYGGAAFRSFREKLDKLFDDLPAPKPSHPPPPPPPRHGISSGSRGLSNMVSAPVTMSRYNKSYAPCFDGSGMVRLADGREKLVKDVRKGDKLTPAALFMENNDAVMGGTVRCVLVTKIREGELKLVTLPPAPNCEKDTTGDARRLRITPYHPVFDVGSNAWRFPADISPPKQEDCSEVYSFLLYLPETAYLNSPNENHHTIIINSIPCVTLGCGLPSIAKHDIRGHPFLGDYAKVVTALKEVDEIGFEMGWVESSGVKREGVGEGLVVGFEKVGRETVAGHGHYVDPDVWGSGKAFERNVDRWVVNSGWSSMAGPERLGKRS